MTISQVCQFELKEEVDKLKSSNPEMSLSECIHQVIQFYENAGIEVKESTAKSKYHRASKTVANATSDVTTENNKEIEEIQVAHGGTRKGAGRKPKHTPPEKPKFNETNDNIEWAKWTWNPVTGCKHGCKYCYARDIAERFYDEKFEPTFRPERLEAPQNTKIPKGRETEPGIKNVFVCSMADLFGDWVPDEWIKSVIESVSNAPQWNFIFLTKNPKRYLEFEFPNNCWLGATADTQERANNANNIFQQLKDENIQNVLFLSCEPLMEFITLKNFYGEWLIIGGRSRSSRMPEEQPEWVWVEELIYVTRENEAKIYFKPNLKVVPKEYPE